MQRPSFSLEPDQLTVWKRNISDAGLQACMIQNSKKIKIFHFFCVLSIILATLQSSANYVWTWKLQPTLTLSGVTLEKSHQQWHLNPHQLPDAKTHSTVWSPILYNNSSISAPQSPDGLGQKILNGLSKIFTRTRFCFVKLKAVLPLVGLELSVPQFLHGQLSSRAKTWPSVTAQRSCSFKRVFKRGEDFKLNDKTFICDINY